MELSAPPAPGRNYIMMSCECSQGMGGINNPHAYSFSYNNLCQLVVFYQANKALSASSLLSLIISSTAFRFYSQSFISSQTNFTLPNLDSQILMRSLSLLLLKPPHSQFNDFYSTIEYSICFYNFLSSRLKVSDSSTTDLILEKRALFGEQKGMLCMSMVGLVCVVLMIRRQ